MKYNSPCADTAGSAGEGLRKKGGTSMRKRNKVVSLLLAGCMAAGLLAGCGSSGGTQVATADNATAASTSTGAADSAAPAFPAFRTKSRLRRLRKPARRKWRWNTEPAPPHRPAPRPAAAYRRNRPWLPSALSLIHI